MSCPRSRRTSARTGLANWNRYAAVNDEFIDIHMDADAAKAVGMPDVFGMGNLRIAYLHNLLHDWLGDDGDIVDVPLRVPGPQPARATRSPATARPTARRERRRPPPGRRSTSA